VSEAAHRALRRSGWGIAAAALATGWLGVARAEPSSWLGWSAPAECQNTSEVERRLESLLGHSFDAASLPPTRVRLGWNAERGWAVRVTVQLAEGERERAVDVPSCADAFDVVALSLALILDPSFGGQGAEAPATEAPLGEPPSAVEPALGSPLPTTMPENEGASPAEAVDAGADEPVPAVPRMSKPQLNLVASGGALTDLDVFPVPQFGGSLQLALGIGAFRVELEGDALASESTLFTGAQYPVSFHSLTSALRGCYTFELSEHLEWLGCAGAQLGELGAHEHGGESRSSRALWLAAEAATGPEFAATGWLRAFARVRAVSPLIRHEFLLSEGTSVHTLPWVSPQLQVGIIVTLTDLGSGGH
jgi:hypothetical protein